MTSSKMIYVYPHEVNVDRAIQRGLNKTWTKRLAGEFNPDYAGALTISVRADGSKIVLDGQHRVAAALEADYEGELPAVAYYGLTREQEAALFNKLNTSQKVMPIDRFLVRVVERDKAALAINEIVNQYGWQVGWGPTSLSSISALEKVYDGAGVDKVGERADLLHAVFQTINGAWGHDLHGAHAVIVGGLGQLYARFGGRVDQEKLINEMAKTRPLTVVGQAKGYKDAVGGMLPAAAGRVFTNMHNRNRRVNRLPDWTWIR